MLSTIQREPGGAGHRLFLMYDIMLLSHYDDRASTMAEQRDRKKLHHCNTPGNALSDSRSAMLMS
jgi:hypothetical protein